MGKAHSNAWRNVGRVLPGRARGAPAGAGRPGPEQASRRPRAATAGRSRPPTGAPSIERDDVDIVDICTPGHLPRRDRAGRAGGRQARAGREAAGQHGRRVRGDGGGCGRAARERGVQSMVGFNYRRVPALALARDLIAEGRIGTVRQVRAAYLQDWLADDAAPMTWRLRKETAGSGVLGDLGSHVVDQLRYLLGEPVASASGHLRTFVHRAHRRRRARAGHRRRRRLGDAGPRPARWPAWRSAGWRPAARTASTSRSTAAAGRSASTSSGSTSCVLDGPGDGTRRPAGAGHRGRPSVPRRLVAARPRAGLGPHVHVQAAEFLAAIGVRHGPARRSRTAWRCSGCSTRSSDECGSRRVPRSTYRQD